MEEQLQYRIDLHNEVLLKKEQTERDLQAQEMSNKELREMLKQLEIEIDNKTANESDLAEVSLQLIVFSFIIIINTAFNVVLW